MLEELKVIIKAETDKFKSSVEDAERQTKSFKEQVAEAGKSVDESLSGAGEKISSGLKIGMTAVAAAGTALLALGASTAEYRNEQSKLVTAFEAAGGSAETAKGTYNDLFRVIGDSGVATEAANHLAKLTTNQQDLSEWTNICQGVYATFGDSIPIEGLTEAANETAKTGALTGSLADALNWAGVSEDDFAAKLEKCNSEAEREKLIRETLNGLYSDAASKFEENNAAILAQNEAQAKLNEAMAALGAATAPVMTMLTNLGARVLTAITPHIQSFANKHLPTIQKVLGEVGEKLGEALDFLLEHKAILAVLGGIIGTVVTAIGLYNAAAAIKAAMDAAQVTTIGALVAAHAAQAVAAMAAMAPYVAIVAAIAAVIAIIVLCIKHWDDIVAVIKKAWETIKDAVKAGVDWVIEFFNKIINFVKENWQGLLLLLVNPVAGAFKLLYDNCDGFREFVNNFVAKVKEIIKAGFELVKQYIIEPVKNAIQTGIDKFNELKTNVTNKISEISSGVKNKFNEIKSNIANVASNIFSTVSDKFNSIKEKISSTINGAKDAVKSAIDKIKGFFNFTWSLPKIKLPHFKISGKFSLDPPSIPKFSVDWYARGGVFDKTTLFGYGNRMGGLGEAGAEAIVPLEKNTQWLDRIATMLNDKMGGGAPIVLQVDGKTFAETSVTTINQLTKQRGSLPLVLA
jgi:archaellum component FlaC